MSEELPSMDSLLECVICLGQLTDPRTLPCLHTYCSACLDHHMKSSATGRQFNCPSCRKTCHVPIGGARDFPKNFFINTMISSITEKAKKKKKKPKPKPRMRSSPQVAAAKTMCANSEEADVHQAPVKFCSECSEYLCPECSTGHRRYKATRQHVLSSIADSSSDEKEEDDDGEAAVPDEPKCQVHFEELTLFCVDCSKSICFQCFNREHLNHHCQELGEAAARMHARLQKMGTFLKTQSGHFQEALQKIQEQREQYTADTNLAKQQLSSSLNEVFRLLEQKRKALQQVLNKTVTQSLSKMQSSEDQLKQKKTKAESLRAHIKDITGASLDDVTILERGPPILSLQNEFQGTPTNALVCRLLVDKQSVNTSELAHLVGNISFEERKQSAVGTVANFGATAAPEDAGVEKLPETLHLVDTIPVSASVSAMTVLNGTVYMVLEGQQNVLTIYDMHQRKFHSQLFQMQSSKPPGTLTITADGTGILITENQPRLDYMVTRALFATLNSAGELCDQTPVTVSGKVTGVNPSDQDGFLVTTIHPKQLSIYSSNHLSKTKISCQETVLLPEERFGNDIKAVQSGESFAVLDSKKRKITWVSRAGTVLLHYGLRQVRLPQSTGHVLPPCYISPYTSEYFLVTDGATYTVTLVKNDGSSVLDILGRNDGLLNPYVTHWDSQRNELYVSQVNVQFRPSHTSRANTSLINVYSLPKLRSSQPEKSTTGEALNEKVVRLTLPSIENVELATAP